MKTYLILTTKLLLFIYVFKALITFTNCQNLDNNFNNEQITNDEKSVLKKVTFKFKQHFYECKFFIYIFSSTLKSQT